MPCFSPLTGWPKRKRSENGKRGITFSRHDAFVDLEMQVPCGQCIGCRLERSRQWAVRIMHESQLHDDNCFITLTYNEDNLPEHGSLRKKDFQNFMKRLRKSIAPQKVRFFHCGEYGEGLKRPHYHAALFGYGFPDRTVHNMRGDHPVWRSAELERLWPAGFSEIGTLTFESAAYVARYITKKINGPRQELHYGVVDQETGELVEKEPEYATMSRRPGIGRGWFEKYGKEVYPSDEVIARGVAQLPPKYYDRILEASDPKLARTVARAREQKRDVYNNTPRRLEVREEVTRARMSTFQKRKYEAESV